MKNKLELMWIFPIRNFAREVTRTNGKITKSDNPYCEATDGDGEIGSTAKLFINKRSGEPFENDIYLQEYDSRKCACLYLGFNKVSPKTYHCEIINYDGYERELKYIAKVRTGKYIRIYRILPTSKPDVVETRTESVRLSI